VSAKRLDFLEAKRRYVEQGDCQPLRNLSLSHVEALECLGDARENMIYLLQVRRLPFTVLDHLAREGDGEIKEFVARKYPLLPETYLFLSSQDEQVRISLASNKKLPPPIFERLRCDDSEIVRQIIRSREEPVRRSRDRPTHPLP
jgi:hypothetical protein